MIAVPHPRNYLYSILLIASAVSAAGPDSTVFNEHTLTPDLLVALVLRVNPGIAELSAAAEAAAFSVEPAGSLDDPVFSYAFAPRTFGREGQGLNQKIELSQSIPWPGTLALRNQIGCTTGGIRSLRLTEVEYCYYMAKLYRETN